MAYARWRHMLIESQRHALKLTTLDLAAACLYPTVKHLALVPVVSGRSR